MYLNLFKNVSYKQGFEMTDYILNYKVDRKYVKIG